MPSDRCRGDGHSLSDPLRGVKFNLPWNSYRVHPSLSQHDETMQKPEFWRRLIPFLADCGFNTLTLWSIHPWSLMVRPAKWPDACPFSDRELADRQTLWKLIFRTGIENGVEIILFNWNIFVSPELARSRGLARYSADLATGYNGSGDYSAEVQEYNRDIVREVLETFPEIGGLGIGQNERMEGVSLERWQQWTRDTWFDIAERYLQDKAFIVRAHTRPAPSMTRRAIEEYPGKLPERTYIDIKFNWSHGHATPDFHYMHEGDDGSALRDPPPSRYKLLFTVRNEDFFGLDYGNVGFMRELVSTNSRDDTGGYLVGSECLIPAKEYIVRPGGDRSWDFLFQRQLLFWCGWGHTLSEAAEHRARPGNHTQPDNHTQPIDDAQAIDHAGAVAGRLQTVARHSLDVEFTAAESLVRAADRASRTANHIATSIASTWDFTHYSEGMIKGVRQDWFGQPFDPTSSLISIRELIDARPLDPDWLSVREYVNGRTDKPVTPPSRTEELLASCHEASAILDDQSLPAAGSQLEAYERACARSWAHLGCCFALRLEAAVLLAREEPSQTGGNASRNSSEAAAATGTSEARRSELANTLLRSRAHYADLCECLDPWIPEPYPLLHLGDRFITEEFEVPMERFHHRDVLRLIDHEIDVLTAKPSR